MGWYCELYTDLLAFTLQLKNTSTKRPSDEGCVTSHSLKWGPLPPNEVGRITQHIREGEGKDRVGNKRNTCNFYCHNPQIRNCLLTDIYFNMKWQNALYSFVPFSCWGYQWCFISSENTQSTKKKVISQWSYNNPLSLCMSLLDMLVTQEMTAKKHVSSEIIIKNRGGHSLAVLTKYNIS